MKERIRLRNPSIAAFFSTSYFRCAGYANKREMFVGGFALPAKEPEQVAIHRQDRKRSITPLRDLLIDLEADTLILHAGEDRLRLHLSRYMRYARKGS